MDFHEIGKIYETSSHEEANEFLDSGWVLIAAAHGTSSGGDGERAYVLYSLGKPISK